MRDVATGARPGAAGRRPEDPAGRGAHPAGSRLKLDMSLITPLGKGDDSARQGNGALVATAINLAHAVGLDTVAEGVSDECQVRSLIGFGCEQGQGYYWAEPLLAAELPPWLAAHDGP